MGRRRVSGLADGSRFVRDAQKDADKVAKRIEKSTAILAGKKRGKRASGHMLPAGKAVAPGVYKRISGHMSPAGRAIAPGVAKRVSGHMTPAGRAVAPGVYKRVKD